MFFRIQFFRHELPPSVTKSSAFAKAVQKQKLSSRSYSGRSSTSSIPSQVVARAFGGRKPLRYNVNVVHVLCAHCDGKPAASATSSSSSAPSDTLRSLIHSAAFSLGDAGLLDPDVIGKLQLESLACCSGRASASLSDCVQLMEQVHGSCQPVCIVALSFLKWLVRLNMKAC